MDPEFWKVFTSDPNFYNTFLMGLWVENAYELLDSPGEWYLNRSTGMLYYKPKPGEDMSIAEVIMPIQERLISGTNLTNVQFKSITFSHGTWLWANSHFIVNGQGDMYIGLGTQMEANIKFDGSSNIRFEKCIFEHLGRGGLQFTTGSVSNVVYDNIFRDISGSAISIGNMTNTTSARNHQIDNNLITHAAEEYHGSVGIFVGYTEQTVITHNEIVNLPYTGISMGWGWNSSTISGKNNEVAYNRIDSVQLRLQDGGAIYTLSAMPGTSIHDNYVSHDFGPYGVLYLDAGSSQLHVYNNVESDSPETVNVPFKTGYAGALNWIYCQTKDFGSPASDDIIENNFYTDPNTHPTLTTDASPTFIVRNNTQVTGGNWPAAALSIMNNAGRVVTQQPPVSVTSVSVSPTSATVNVNATQQLTATVSPSNATNKAVTWSSSNTTVATVSSSGLVTGKTAGTATITVTTVDGSKTATSVITITNVSSGGDGLKGEYYNAKDLSGSVAVTRTDATVNFDWGTGSYATSQPVDNFSTRWTGQVLPKYTGTYTFETETDDGVRLWVNDVQLINKWVDQGPTKVTGTISLTAGTKYNIKMEYYENGGGAVARLRWSSASQAYEIIPQGQLFSTSVATVAVTGVSVSPTTASLTVASTQQLTATVSPSTATNKSVTWSSSNTSVATVSTSGLVTAVAAGTATITVTTVDGSKTATSAITVTNASSGGDGLKGEYYNAKDLSGTVAVTRIDATINFDWGTGSYATGQPVDNFSTRWTGQVLPKYTETYTFETETDDGVRLWVNDVQLINKWVDQGPTKVTGTISLTAGTKYNIKMEYYENGGGAVARSRWSSASQVYEIIPQSQLFSAVTTAGISVLTTQVPAGADSDQPYELGMKFKSTQAGNITKIRYYKMTGESGTHTGRIWSSTGTQLTSIVFSGETATGWQVATLATPLSITANTTYVVSVNSNTNYAVTNNGLQTSFVNGPLSSIADGANGVYNTTPGLFPNSSYLNSNYFRDVVFTSTSLVRLATEQDVTSNVVAYPNPAQDEINIEVSSGLIKHLTVYNNVGGATYQQRNVGKNQVTVEVRNFAAGLYFIKVETDDNKMVMKKVIVEK